TIMRIRPARVDEAMQLTMIETAAARTYAAAGIPPDLDGLELEVVEAAIAEELVWVATDDDDRPVGFALAWLRPNAMHLRELDVLPSHMRRGIGRSLVEFVCAQARARSLAGVTLTTFRDVAWNAPLYRRWNFEVVEPEACPGWLTEIRIHEDLGGLRR